MSWEQSRIIERAQFKRRRPDLFCPHPRCLMMRNECRKHREKKMRAPEVKLFEIRDRMTCISAMATAITGEAGPIARHAGFDSGRTVVLTVFHAFKGENTHSEYDPYGWDTGARTIPEAHRHIARNWDALRDGDVVDVEYILRETRTPKDSELG